MIAFILYSLIIAGLILYNGFFGLFADNRISKKQFAGFFILKLMAIPAFYLVYSKLYGGMERFDAGIFYNDSKAANALAYENPMAYFKMLLGLQGDAPGDYFYEHVIVHTRNWDNGRIRNFLYNDNRVVIRIHSLLHFIAFNSYFVHALFSCFLSFIGIRSLYKALKDFFAGKELWMLCVLCFLPALWFYTGALLKEGLVIFCMGSLVYLLKLMAQGEWRFSYFFWLAVLVFISLVLKPYVLFFSGLCFALFFMIQNREKTRHRFVMFLSALLLTVLAANILSLAAKHKTLVGAALARQRVFADAAKGGIFLLDSVKFVRLEFDSSLVTRIKSKPDHFIIKKNAPYMYWEHTHQQDTLACQANQDTITQYTEVYRIPESGSNFSLATYGNSVPAIVLNCWYYSLFYPLFFNARSALQLLASLENALIILSLIIIIMGLMRNKKDSFLPLVLVFITLSVCLLIGLTTPNSGAIFRYRSPVVILLLLAALYYADIQKLNLFRQRERFN